MTRTRRRLWTLVRIGSRDVLRDPVLIGLVIVIPLYFVGVWGQVIPDEPTQVTVQSGTGEELVHSTLVEVITPLMAVTTGALLLGIAALFIVQRSLAADRRLQIAGARGIEILLARFGLLAGLGLGIVFLSTIMTVISVRPAHLIWYVLGLVLAAGVYAVLGAGVGFLLGRIAGVYTLLFLPLIDIVILQNPLAEAPDWAVWLPGHHATELAISAAFAEEVAMRHGVWATGAIVVLALAVIFIARTR